MKRLFTRFAILIVFAALIPSCELLEDCKTCTEVLETNGVPSFGSSAVYCGAELADKETEVVIIENGRSYYECI